MKRLFSILTSIAGSIALLLLIFYGPAYLEPKVNADKPLEWMSGDPVEWQGIIRIWSIHDDVTRIDTDWMQATLKRYEKLNKGVYIEYANISQTEADIRHQRNESADIIIYPQQLAVSANGAEIEMTFSLPAPKEEKLIVSDLEFDIIDENDKNKEVEEREEMLGYVMHVGFSEYDNFEQSSKLAAYIAEQAVSMVK